MSTEDRLHRLISTVGDSELDPSSWASFVAVAHRDLLRHRIVAASALVATVAIASLGTAAVLNMDRADLPIPPSAGNAVAPIPEDVPTECDAAPEFAGGPLGTAAYLGATDLHVVDVATGEDWALVQTGEEFGERFFGSEVRISPDGRWVSFGEGLMVPTAGGEVCAPLGHRVQEVQWTSDGQAVGLSKGSLVVGGPGRDPHEFHWEGFLPEFYSLAVDTNREVVAAAAREGDEGGVWTIDLTSEEVARFTSLPTDGLDDLEIAGWSPDGRWVLFWTKFPNSESLDADGSPLLALDVQTEEVVPVAEVVISARDQLAWCGDRLLFTDGVGRLMQDKKVIAAAQPPAWNKTVVLEEEGSSFVDPACDATGSTLAAIKAPTDGTWTTSLVTQGGTQAGLEAGSEEAFLRPSLSSDGAVIIIERVGKDGTGELFVIDGEGSERSLGILGSPSSFIQVGGSPSWDWHRP